MEALKASLGNRGAKTAQPEAAERKPAKRSAPAEAKPARPRAVGGRGNR